MVKDLAEWARWNPANSSLDVSVNVLPTDIQVSVWNLHTGELLLLGNTFNDSASLTLSSRAFSSVPCEVAIFAQGRFQAIPVNNTGISCDLLGNALPLIESQLPMAVLTSPLSDETIKVGSSVYFSADFITGGSYYWAFSGAAPESNSRIPGNVLFSLPGTFTATLMVFDGRGVASPVLTRRVITVVP
ncbi:MAG: hypothetical protein OEX19_16990 [Gammaproteobacteria bacterium]|nr:hypothetical protein [Gammaproteobacteria bacterium]